MLKHWSTNAATHFQRKGNNMLSTTLNQFALDKLGITKLSEMIVYAGLCWATDEACSITSDKWCIEFDALPYHDDGPRLFCNVFNCQEQSSDGEDKLEFYEQVSYNPQAANNLSEISLLVGKLLRNCPINEI